MSSRKPLDRRAVLRGAQFAYLANRRASRRTHPGAAHSRASETSGGRCACGHEGGRRWLNAG